MDEAPCEGGEDFVAIKGHRPLDKAVRSVELHPDGGKVCSFVAGVCMRHRAVGCVPLAAVDKSVAKDRGGRGGRDRERREEERNIPEAPGIIE
jgi:hypothetical protein